MPLIFITFVIITMRIWVVLFSFFASVQLFAQNSTLGIDIYNEFGSMSSSIKRETYLLPKILNSTPYIPNSFHSTQFIKGYNCINARLVFKAKPFVLKKFAPNQEFSIGAGFYTMNSSIIDDVYLFYDSMGLNGRTYKNYMSYNLYTHQEQIHAQYLFNSKVLRNHFKFYSGLGIKFGLLTTKTIQRNRTSAISYSSRIDSDTMFTPYHNSVVINGSYSHSTASVFVPIGLKYNLSCNFNLFTEFQLGWQFSPGIHKTTGVQQFFSLALGLRYKFLKDENTPESNHVFW